VPVLRQPARPGGAHLPPGQRIPTLNADPAPPSVPDVSDLLELLTRGELEIHGRLTEASNATLYSTATLNGTAVGCVYKPVAGEKPLWDFPARTLARREVAAYELSVASGLAVVPPTVLRDGPFGLGSVQWWVTGGSSSSSDPVGDGPVGPGGLPGAAEPVMGELGAGVVDVIAPNRVPDGWLHVLDAEGGDGGPVVLAHADDPTLRRMALFDAVTNNTDRKGGHILRHFSGAIYGVDHGLTFNEEDKLRTVLWGWAGDPLGDEAVEVLDRLVTDLSGASELRSTLEELLSAREVNRTARRAAQLLRRRRYPTPPADNWRAIPWPPF
jgi:uncharacterized repeat protein (TIGR03843 family)